MLLVNEKREMKLILSGKSWDSTSSFLAADSINPRLRRDLSIILIDNCEQEPDVFKVTTNVFKNNKSTILSEKTTEKLNSIIATIEVRSNEELINAIKQGKKEKKEGKTRKYEDIAKECGLR